METAVIRQCGDRDIVHVARMQRQWEQEAITYGFVAATEEQLAARLGPFFLVAEQEGSLVGFIMGSKRTSEGLAVLPQGQEFVEIEDLFVKPGCRSSGVGGQLVSRLKDAAQQRGIERFLVYSATKDVDAMLAFYRKSGFKPWFVQMYI